jgi:hypothetical protein
VPSYDRLHFEDGQTRNDRSALFQAFRAPGFVGCVIMQMSPCHTRSQIFATVMAMPALIFSASKPVGKAGSEKSTVSPQRLSA